MEYDSKEYLAKIDNERKMLRDKLSSYKSFMSQKVYRYYLNLLKLNTNAWNEHTEDQFKLYDREFSDIVAFNLTYYMANVLGKYVDKDLFCLKSRYYGSRDTLICDSGGHKTALVSWHRSNQNFSDLISNWEIVLFQKVYGVEFNKRKLSAMKKLYDEMNRRSNDFGINKKYLEGAIFQLERIEQDDSIAYSSNDLYFNQLNYELELMVKSREMILKTLSKEYDFSIPDVDDFKLFDEDYSNMTDEELIIRSVDLSKKKVSVEYNVKENSRGIIRVNKLFYDKRYLKII